MNVDSTQGIMDMTVKADGKWTVYNGTEVLVQANAPDKVNMDVVEEWCGYVRSAVNNMRPSDEEMLARKKRRKEEEDGSSTVSNPSSPGSVLTDSDGNSSSNDVVTPQVRAFDEDPEGYAVERWHYFSERASVAEQELEQLQKLARQWEAIAAAAQGADNV